MAEFSFSHPIEVRYGDLDPQGHVNNASYLTYLEQARIHYFLHLKLWEGKSWMDIGIILADAQVTFRAPILFDAKVQVAVRVSRLGNKSLTMEYCIEDAHTGRHYATASTVLVTYDYHTQQTIPIPSAWREAIQALEGMQVSG